MSNKTSSINHSINQKKKQSKRNYKPLDMTTSLNSSENLKDELPIAPRKKLRENVNFTIFIKKMFLPVDVCREKQCFQEHPNNHIHMIKKEDLRIVDFKHLPADLKEEFEENLESNLKDFANNDIFFICHKCSGDHFIEKTFEHSYYDEYYDDICFVAGTSKDVCITCDGYGILKLSL
jgi:hypothetical protein